MVNLNIRIGELLLRNGLITQEQLDDALAYQKTGGKGEKLGSILISKGYVSEEDFVDVLHLKLDVPVVDLSRMRVNAGATGLVPQSVALKYTCLPVDYDEETISVAMWDPSDYYGIEEIEMTSRRKVRAFIAKRSAIRAGIERAYAGAVSTEVIDSANREYDAGESALFDEESAERVNSAPVVQLVDAMLNQAAKLRASDVHIEPLSDRVRIRFRVDGELLEVMSLKPSVLTGLVTRIKIMSNMDIAEKRVPQDGRFTTMLGASEMHARVASMPTVFGEKIVIRLLGDASTDVPDVSALGMNEANKRLFLRLLDVPAGIVLVTGPTGSGKTTTLYSAMRQLSRPAVNVVSIEDPVEKSIEGMNQMQINPKAGITFATGLRALLRQDPDIIMIGEIRDPETAEIAARAAITGHLVMSTIHTNDAVSAFARLVDMGVEAYIVASAMMGVISQRLVRVLCPHCKRETAAGPEERKLVPELAEGERIYRPVGCIQCNNTGYFGRTAVHEILPVTSEIRELIAAAAPVERIREVCLRAGMRTLRENMLELVRSGTSSIPEMVRITFSLD